MVAERLTDDFYRSSVLLNYTWPPLHDFAKFPLLVSYYPAKVRLKSEMRKGEARERRC